MIAGPVNPHASARFAQLIASSSDTVYLGPIYGDANEAEPLEANSIECNEGFDPNTAEVCPIPAAAMIIHHGCTLHGASANKSNTSRLAYILIYKTPPRSHKELGEFPWNQHVGKSSRMQRRRWLLRGGILPELLRFMRSDPDAHRHCFEQVRRFFRR